MADEADAFDLFGSLFDEQPNMDQGVPNAPPLLERDGRPVHVPFHLAKQFVYGGQQEQMPDCPPLFGPFLRRDPSLSLNTRHALDSRLLELQSERITAEHAHKTRMLELETALKREMLCFEEKRTQIERESEAIKKAIAKVERREKEEADSEAEEKRQLNVVKPPAITSPLSTRRSPGEDPRTGDETGCGVCLDADRDALLAPCGHVVACSSCATAIHKSNNPECPFCRVRIQGVYKLFVV